MTNFEKAIGSNTKGLDHVNPGMASCCADCQSSLGLSKEKMEKRLEGGSLDDEGGFSWSPCECCGSKLGGNRYAAHGFDKNGEVVHLEVCEDCLCFLANGDVPEKWEG